MEYAARRTSLPNRRSLVAPLVALVVGAGAAIGTFALIDDDPAPASPDVIVVEQPGPGQAVRGIDDMANAPSESVRPQTDGIANRTDPHGPGHALHRTR